MQIPTNHQAREEQTTKAKLEYGADHVSLASTLEQILEHIEAKWSSSQDSPMVGEMVHQASASAGEIPITQPWAEQRS